MNHARQVTAAARTAAPTPMPAFAPVESPLDEDKAALAELDFELEVVAVFVGEPGFEVGDEEACEEDPVLEVGSSFDVLVVSAGNKIWRPRELQPDTRSSVWTFIRCPLDFRKLIVELSKDQRRFTHLSYSE